VVSFNARMQRHRLRSLALQGQCLGLAQSVLGGLHRRHRIAVAPAGAQSISGNHLI
jgi:hypothetical protein